MSAVAAATPLRTKIYVMAAVVSVTAAMACGGGSSIANPVGPSLPNRSMSAVVDGVPWHANLFVGGFGGASVGMLGINGIWSSTGDAGPSQRKTMSLTVAASSVGTFTIADGSVISMSFHEGPYPSVGGPTSQPPSWFASSVGGVGSGTITITMYSQSRVTGTFSFVGEPGSPATGTRTITDGKFDVIWE